MKPENKIYLQNVAEWREWLVQNHNSIDGVWLVYYKKNTGKPSIPYNESVEQAICFGWIDNLVKRIDDERYMRKFTPRKPGSNWSESNKKRADKMILEGKVTKSGLVLIENAKKEGVWNKKPTWPETFSDELVDLLKKNEPACKKFNQLAPSHQKNYVRWIMNAKKPETRIRRFDKMVRNLLSGTSMGLK